VPAHADTTLPQPAAARSWADSCAARIDAAAKFLELKPGARPNQIPLLDENGAPNPMQRVDYCDQTGISCVSVGTDSRKTDSDKHWTRTKRLHVDEFFRRARHRWAKVLVEQSDVDSARTLMSAADECLKMGDSK
jgi:hypothetical protein